MKFFTVFALIASAAALPHGGVVNTGSSAVQRSDDGHGNYAFGYNEDHATGGTFRKEKGGPGYMAGSYGLRDHDGRVRTVNYVADAHGYRASVSTNEPGTDVKQDPAAVNLNYGGAHAGVIPDAPLSYDHGYGHGAYAGHAGLAGLAGHGLAGHGGYAVQGLAHGLDGAYGGHGGYAGHGVAFPSSYSVGISHHGAYGGHGLAGHGLAGHGLAGNGYGHGY